MFAAVRVSSPMTTPFPSMTSYRDARNVYRSCISPARSLAPLPTMQKRFAGFWASRYARFPNSLMEHKSSSCFVRRPTVAWAHSSDGWAVPPVDRMPQGYLKSPCSLTLAAAVFKSKILRTQINTTRVFTSSASGYTTHKDIMRVLVVWIPSEKCILWRLDRAYSVNIPAVNTKRIMVSDTSLYYNCLTCTAQ